MSRAHWWNDGGGAEVLREKPVKGRAIPLQAWTGTESSRRLRLPNLKTIGT